MAYHLTYICDFNNEITENIFIEIYRKDVVPDSVTTLRCTYCNKKFLNGQGDKFDTIISSELNLGLYIGVNDAVEFDDILVSFSDEWKVILKSDGQIDFVGFLVPNECKASFRDKPYDIELTATDGLGYLREVFLTDIGGIEFTGTSLLIQYLAACLKKTLHDLNIRVYCNIYEDTFIDRNTDPQKDMFNQAKVDYRTYQVNPTEFMKCFDVLTSMLKQGFSLFQWFGKWVVMRIAELQYSPGPLIWYTEYDSNGVIINGQLEDFSAAQVAKQQILHPVSANQDILSRFATKFVRLSYLYSIWPEIPKNNKFERGTVFEVGALAGGGTYEKQTIDDWLYGITNPSNPSTQPPDGMLPTTDLAYKYTTFNIYGVETFKEVVLERNGGVAGHRFLRCEKVPVRAGDRIRINIDYATSQAGTGTRQYLMVMLEPTAGGTPYRLDQPGGAPADGIGTLVWAQTFSMRFLAKFYDTGEDASKYTSFTIEPPELPATGDLYILYTNFDPPVGRIVRYKGFSLEYFPYVAGQVGVEGDYWNTSQNVDYRDSVDEEIGLSDSPIKVSKGALLRTDGETLTQRWHRLNINESREYKELINIGRYNGSYRRTWEISGSFGGTMFHPMNDQTIRLPLGFHKQFVFPNSTRLDGYYFQLVPPLTIDYVAGVIDATFVDCMKVENGSSIDGNQLGDVHEFKYIFKNA